MRAYVNFAYLLQCNLLIGLLFVQFFLLDLVFAKDVKLSSCQLPMDEYSVKVCATRQRCTITSMLVCVVMHMCMG